jgi:hypothetical protein
VAQEGFDAAKVLLAIEELRRWEQRQREISGAYGSGVGASPQEVARVRQQITYYDGLLQDMKRRAHPDSMSRFMSRVAHR